MQQDRAHPPQCEKATGSTCRCAHCAGAQHGWRQALRLASGPEGEFRRFAENKRKRWERVRRAQRRGPTLPVKKAAADLAAVDLIRYLRDGAGAGGSASSDSAAGGSEPPDSPRGESAHNTSEAGDRAFGDAAGGDAAQSASAAGEAAARDSAGRSPELGNAATGESAQRRPRESPGAEDDAGRALATARTELDRVESLGRLLLTSRDAVEERSGGLRTATREAMADHLWCDLLVQLVVLVEEADELLGSVPDRLAARILRTRATRGFAALEREVVTACVEQVWARLRTALGLDVVSDAAGALPALRILAVLLCKQPPKHPAVVKHGIDPLGHLLLDETRERLTTALGDFLPRIAAAG